jgi:hypothetical protein
MVVLISSRVVRRHFLVLDGHVLSQDDIKQVSRDGPEALPGFEVRQESD